MSNINLILVNYINLLIFAKINKYKYIVIYMTNNYYCKICKYTTNRQQNLQTHFKSKAHIKNEYKYKEKNDEVEKIRNEIKKQFIDKLDKLEKSVKELEEYKTKYHNIVDKVIENGFDITKLALNTTAQATKTTKKSMSAINYLIKNYSNNKSFYSYNLDTIPDHDLAMIASDPKHMSKVLVNTFIGTNLKKAGVRCLDATRLRFTLKGEDNWIIDTSGEIIKEKAIKPITERAYNFINNRMSKMIITHGNNISTDEIIVYQRGIENIKSLGEEKLQNKILKKFGSKCMIDRTQLTID